MHQLTQLRIIGIVVLIAMTFLTNPFHSPPPTQAHTIKYPIIIIPGFPGTTLKAPDVGASVDDYPDGHGGRYTHVYDPFEEIWINPLEAVKPGYDDYFDALKLEADGKTPITSLGRGDAVKEVYQPTIDYFLNKGYVLNRDIYVFAYDWRMDIRDNDEQFNDLVENAKQRTGLSKVNIIAHSMGGLVLRNYITNPQHAQNINNAVTLGTPYLGAPEILKWLMYGGCVKFPVGPLCLSLASSETKDILQNMIPVYQLMPSKKYFEIYNGSPEHPTPFKDSRDIDNNGVTGELNYLQIKELLTNLNHNTSLFQPAEQFRESIDQTIPDIPGGTYNIIVGSGKPTLGQIVERNVVTIGNVELNKKDQIIVNGDNSVPLYSASLNDQSTNFSLSGNAHLYFTKQEHSKLPSDPYVLNLINFLFNGNTTGTYDFNNIATTPIPLKGRLLSVHSPVNIEVYDQSGNHVGLMDSGDLEQQIPQSSYDTLDDAKFIWLEKDGNYTVIIKATDEGFFDLRIRDFIDDKVTKQREYLNIPLTLDTSGLLELHSQDSNDPKVLIDNNSDGQFDMTISPTVEQNMDTLPPVTQMSVTGQAGTNNWYGSDVTVTLNATDNPQGSGVSKIAYSTNQGEIFEYTQPIHISSEGSTDLDFYSVDNQGNAETVQSHKIKIDKTSPEVQAFFNLQNQNLEIIGIDAISQTETVQIREGEMLIKDEADNRLTLTYSPKDKKKKDTIQIDKFRYDNNPSIIPLKNELKVAFEVDKKTGNLKELTQKFGIKGETKIETEYKTKTNQTKIQQKIFKSQKEKYELEGIAIIKVFTDKGQLLSNITL